MMPDSNLQSEIERIIKLNENKRPRQYIASKHEGFYYRAMQLPQILFVLSETKGIIIGTDFHTLHSFSIGHEDVLFFNRYETCRDYSLKDPFGKYSDDQFDRDAEELFKRTGGRIDVRNKYYFKTSFLLSVDPSKCKNEFYHVRGNIYAYNGPFPVHQFSDESKKHIIEALSLDNESLFYKLLSNQ